MKSVFVIIPAYNEEKTIAKVIRKTEKYCNNIVVIDDGSKDKTYEMADREREKIKKKEEVKKRKKSGNRKRDKKNKTGKKNIFILKHAVNLGKGASIITGSEFASSKGADILIYLDADLQHNPKYIPQFLKALENADSVFGIRKFNKKMPFVLRLGNYIINKTIKILYGINLKDTQCGYRALTKKTYKKIKWKSSDYSMESEMIAKIGKKHLRYKEIPIETSYPNKYKGTTIFHGIKIILEQLIFHLEV